MANTKGKNTPRRIVELALQLLLRKGYFNTSISDILEATDLTKGGLYGHFRSKEDVWYAVYEKAARVWRKIVLIDVRGISDPIERVLEVIKRSMRDYLGADIFDGGCFFVNSLVELSGQSSTMTRHILRGFVRFSKLPQSWLEEAYQEGILREGINFKEAGNFIVISLNGAATLYSASKDPGIWKQTITQPELYVNQLRK